MTDPSRMLSRPPEWRLQQAAQTAEALSFRREDGATRDGAEQRKALGFQSAEDDNAVLRGASAQRQPGRANASGRRLQRHLISADCPKHLGFQRIERTLLPFEFGM